MVNCEDTPLENVFRFKYLGSVFTADGLQLYDVKERIAKSFAACGRLRHIFDSPALNIGIKLRLYVAAVCSVLTYGCETWDLNMATMRRLNNANSKMLARITGRSIPTEARPATTSYNLVRNIRIRRYKWVGMILRSDKDRLIFNALKVQHEMGSPGNLLMDVPPFVSFDDLTDLAADKAGWNSRISGIKTHQ